MSNEIIESGLSAVKETIDSADTEALKKWAKAEKGLHALRMKAMKLYTDWQA